MEARAYYHEVETGTPQGFETAELLENVASLRQDVSSVMSEVHAVLKENERLKAEVSRLRQNRGGGQRVSEIHRMKQEIDELINMHTAATQSRRRPRETSERESWGRGDSRGNDSWMKKMMMVMMLAEMV